MGGQNDSVSRIAAMAGVAALTAPALLIACVAFAFAYDVDVGLGGLIAAFLLALVPLTLVAVMDVVSWRRLTARADPPILPTAAGDTFGFAAAGLMLLLLGSVVTVIEVGVGGSDKVNDFAVWTSTAVGYLVLSALVAQAALLALTMLKRRQAVALDG